MVIVMKSKNMCINKPQIESTRMLHKLYDKDSAPFDIPSAYDLILEKLTWWKWFEKEYDRLAVPFDEDSEIQEYCKKEGILLEAWSPLMRGEALSIPFIVELSKKHNVTPAQIILAWDICEGISVIPKSTKRDRMEENFASLKVELSKEEVEALNKLHNGIRRYRDPDNHGFGNQ